MILGVGMAALGGLLTLGSQANAAENGGSYTVFIGLMLFGAITFCRGLYYYSKGSRSRGFSQPMASRSATATQPVASLRATRAPAAAKRPTPTDREMRLRPGPLTDSHDGKTPASGVAQTPAGNQGAAAEHGHAENVAVTPLNGTKLMSERRRISYNLGTEVETSEGNLVAVLGCDDDVQWLTPLGGTVEPAEGAKFCRLRVMCENVSEEQDVGSIADAFGLEVEDGSIFQVLRESHADDELRALDGAGIEEGQRLEGFVYFEIGQGHQPSYGIFTCSRQEDENEIWLRWKVAQDPTVGGQGLGASRQDLYDLVVMHCGYEPRRVARVISEETGENSQNILASFHRLPSVVASGVGFATAEGLRSAISKSGAVAEIRKLN